MPIGIIFALQVRNRLTTFKNWPFSEEEGSDCTPARFSQFCFKCRMKGCSGWQRQAFMPVEEIMNLTWHDATSAGAAHISSAYIHILEPGLKHLELLALKVHPSGKSWMGGILRMTPGLSMCLMQRCCKQPGWISLVLREVSSPPALAAAICMKYSVTVTTSFQGKCAFVNLGKKASELTVADVSRSEISLLISSFLSGLGCAWAS